MRKLAFVAIIIAIAAALYFTLRPARKASRSDARQAAADFSLPQLNGQMLRLSDFHGKVVLLDFWATWCDPCRDETPHLIELQSKYRDRGLQIIGISMDDSPEPVRNYHQKFKMNYAVVMGNADVGTLYGGILGLPVAFVLDRDGRIYKKHVGATDVSALEREIQELLSQ